MPLHLNINTTGVLNTLQSKSAPLNTPDNLKCQFVVFRSSMCRKYELVLLLEIEVQLELQ